MLVVEVGLLHIYGLLIYLLDLIYIYRTWWMVSWIILILVAFYMFCLSLVHVIVVLDVYTFVIDSCKRCQENYVFFGFFSRYSYENVIDFLI